MLYLTLLVLALGGLSAFLIYLLVKGSRQKMTSDVQLQLTSLHRSLEALEKQFTIPHLRGAFGEVVLSELLASYLPTSAYDLQHHFLSSGKIVDATVKIGPRLLPIDSKFPIPQSDEELSVASLSKKLVLYGQSISEKYILPEEGTFPFALMFIPSEKIYYHVFVEEPKTSQSLRALHVTAVSPSTLTLYLETIMRALREISLSQSQEEALSLIEELSSQRNQVRQARGTWEGHLQRLTARLDEESSALDNLFSTIEKLSKIAIKN